MQHWRHWKHYLSVLWSDICTLRDFFNTVCSDFAHYINVNIFPFARQGGTICMYIGRLVRLKFLVDESRTDIIGLPPREQTVFSKESWNISCRVIDLRGKGNVYTHTIVQKYNSINSLEHPSHFSFHCYLVTNNTLSVIKNEGTEKIMLLLLFQKLCDTETMRFSWATLEEHHAWSQSLQSIHPIAASSYNLWNAFVSATCCCRWEHRQVFGCCKHDACLYTHLLYIANTIWEATGESRRFCEILFFSSITLIPSFLFCTLCHYSGDCLNGPLYCLNVNYFCSLCAFFLLPSLCCLWLLLTI